MQQGRGGMGSRKHGKSGHASRSPRFRLWARLKPSAHPSRSAPRRNSVARFVSFFLEESQAEPVDRAAHSGLAARMARHIFSEVAGISIAGAPTLASASLTAFIPAQL